MREKTVSKIAVHGAGIADGIPPGSVSRPGLGNYFYTKMLFSALTDADWLDTEAYFLKIAAVTIAAGDLKGLG